MRSNTDPRCKVEDHVPNCLCEPKEGEKCDGTCEASSGRTGGCPCATCHGSKIVRHPAARTNREWKACPKCSPSLPQEQESWEKEFDEKFASADYDFLSDKKKLCEHIKNFIRSTRDEAFSEAKKWVDSACEGTARGMRAALLKEIEGMRQKVISTDKSNVSVNEKNGYNQALLDLKSKLTERE